MKIVIFTHPDFLQLRSMQRFSRMIAGGMMSRGHQVDVWCPRPFFYALSFPRILKKWMGYIDQYVVFPIAVKKRLAFLPKDTLFVFTDHALGPWVPLVSGRPNVIHCHDFIAQRSGLREAENPISITGRQYQAYIRRGYSKCIGFISVSEKTKTDLEWFLQRKPKLSEVIYNGLDPVFKPSDIVVARSSLSKQLNMDLSNGYILHVGGNQWYKNRTGVIDVYNEWRKQYQNQSPLIMIGESPSEGILARREKSEYGNDIHFLTDAADDIVQKAYSGASVFFFPSLAEGFGWPIAEAMASGTLVITTNEAPMSAVAGDAAMLIERCPIQYIDRQKWLTSSASVLQHAITLTPGERIHYINRGLINIQRFNMETALDKIEKVYKRILNDSYSSRLN